MAQQSPYIVTFRRKPQFVLPPTHELDRQAVATIQEARDAARDECFQRDYDAGEIAPFIKAAETIPETGGTVGPLPDGTLIEVERVKWAVLIQATLDAGKDNFAPLVIAAFNEAQRTATNPADYSTGMEVAKPPSAPKGATRKEGTDHA